MSPIVLTRLRLNLWGLAAVFIPILGAGQESRDNGNSNSSLGIRIGFEDAAAPKIVGTLSDWVSNGPVEWRTGFHGRGPHFSKPGASLLFQLPEAGGNALNLREGSIRFRFRPDWNSGTGPGAWASLLSIGVWTPDPATIGYWALGTNPTGDQITFSAQKVGEGRTYLRVPFQFQKEQWYDMLLVYSPASTRLFVDGVELGPGGGVSVQPSRAVVAEYGLRIGNNHHGNQPIHGMIDELEVSREQRNSFDQRRERFAINAIGFQSPTRVSLDWPLIESQTQQVKRRETGQASWSELGFVVSTNRFVDRSPALKSGRAYEYLIGQKRLGAILGLRPAIENRGRVMLVIARDVAEKIEESLAQFTSDLVGDGWMVESIRVPEHDMRRRSRYRSRVMGVKSAIKDFYLRKPEKRNVVILVGNVPIPYSGFRAEDGHHKIGDDHRGAWPCDAFYGDMDGEWTDETVDHINRTNRSNTNRPRDGKFDQDYLPSSLEVAVSRIDFSNLPGIAGKSLPGHPISSSRIEEGLLRRYFEKNHRYRFARTTFSNRAVYQSYLPRRLWNNMDRNAFRSSAALFGGHDLAVSEADCFLISEPVKWGFLAGYGGRQSLGSGRYKTQQLNQPEMGPKAAFLMLYSSWSGDWNLRDSFTKSMLVKPSNGLAVMSSIHGQWVLTSLAFGDPLASAYLDTAEESVRGRTVARSMSVLGDATLRMHVLAPVAPISGVVGESFVQLTWAGGDSAKDEMGYFVYRSASQDGPYRRISGERPVAETSYVDRAPRADEGFYMVRRVAVETTPAGKYLNLSQGRFWIGGD